MQDEGSARTRNAGTDEEAAQAALAEGLRALDQDAWATLYDAHHLQIWRYAFGRTGSRDAADEAAADVFAEAVASIQRYHYRGRPILAWLYGIARNITSKQLRRARREPGTGEAEPSSASLEGRIVDAMALAAALDRLTSDQRDVIVLRYFVGYSTAEIAVVMGKNEAAVYSLEVRAVGALRRQFDEEERHFPA